MANDININNPAGLHSTIQRGMTGSTSNAERKAAEALPTQSSADRVSVTSEAARLQEIEEQLMAVPEVNAQRVAEIKAQIAAGTFDLNPQRIAEKLIAFESGSKS